MNLFFKNPIFIGTVLVFIVISAYVKGYIVSEEKYVKKELKLLADIENIKAQKEKINTKVVTAYVDKIIEIEGKTKEIIKNVPIYITKNSNSKCTIPIGFVKLHNNAASNSQDGPTGNVDEEAEGIDFIRASETIAENYGIYHKTSEQLIQLQNWVMEQNN